MKLSQEVRPEAREEVRLETERKFGGRGAQTGTVMNETCWRQEIGKEFQQIIRQEGRMKEENWKCSGNRTSSQTRIQKGMDS